MKAKGARAAKKRPAPDASRLARALLFPVRHHSPRTSAVLAALLEREQPELVLIEGPEDATALAPVLADPDTRPPVAILGYRTDDTPGSTLWPFAAYSPEYVAVKWAVTNHKKVAFIDVPSGVALSCHAEGAEGADADFDDDPGDFGLEGADDSFFSPDDSTDDAPDELPDASEAPLDVHRACAEARGFRSFEEFWEASFEAPDYTPEEFREALIAYADLVRATDRRPLHRMRDAFMAMRVLEAMDNGFEPEQIAVVVGAAHAAAFAVGDVDFALAEHLPKPVASAVTLIPFSFPRLAEQMGYGAGNRAPQYYQRAHEAGCDFRRATLEVLVEFAEHLRLRGFSASLSDIIEAYRLAVMLSDMRGKAAPGLDELREATIATLCRGEAKHVDGFLWPSVIGQRVGRVADRIGKNSLQEEFWREIEARRLPATDAPERFTLQLRDPVQVETSVFLHRLRVAAIPYATFVGQRAGQGGVTAGDASALDALTRVRETWEAQWTPSTDAALIEKIVLGDSLEQVTTRLLEERLDAAHVTSDAAGALLEAVVTKSPRTVAAALDACDRFASSDDDLPSLARAASVLSALVSFGTSRAGVGGADKAIAALCQKTFARAVLRVHEACTGSAEAVDKPKGALVSLHDVALKQSIVDRDAWFSAARALVYSYSVHPSTSGLAAGLLYLGQVLGDDDITRVITQRLSNTFDPEGAAAFLEGFLQVNALSLVKSRPVVAALDAFLTGIDAARFRDALPVLRRAFSALGKTERRYLLESVLAVRGLGDRAQKARAVLHERDRKKIEAMSAELSKAMDDLDDLL